MIVIQKPRIDLRRILDDEDRNSLSFPDDIPVTLSYRGFSTQIATTTIRKVSYPYIEFTPLHINIASNEFANMMANADQNGGPTLLNVDRGLYIGVLCNSINSIDLRNSHITAIVVTCSHAGALTEDNLRKLFS